MQPDGQRGVQDEPTAGEGQEVAGSDEQQPGRAQPERSLQVRAVNVEARTSLERRHGFGIERCHGGQAENDRCRQPVPGVQPPLERAARHRQGLPHPCEHRARVKCAQIHQERGRTQHGEQRNWQTDLDQARLRRLAQRAAGDHLREHGSAPHDSPQYRQNGAAKDQDQRGTQGVEEYRFQDHRPSIGHCTLLRAIDQIGLASSGRRGIITGQRSPEASDAIHTFPHLPPPACCDSRRGGVYDPAQLRGVFSARTSGLGSLAGQVSAGRGRRRVRSRRVGACAGWGVAVGARAPVAGRVGPHQLHSASGPRL